MSDRLILDVTSLSPIQRGRLMDAVLFAQGCIAEGQMMFQASICPIEAEHQAEAADSLKRAYSEVLAGVAAGKEASPAVPWEWTGDMEINDRRAKK